MLNSTSEIDNMIDRQTEYELKLVRLRWLEKPQDFEFYLRKESGFSSEKCIAANCEQGVEKIGVSIGELEYK